MADTKHPAEVLADSAHLSYRVGWRRQAEEMLRRIPALEAAAHGIADAEAVIAWATSEDRKPSMHAFTDGPERQAAYWIEWAENRACQDYQRLLDKHNALHMNTRAARDRVAALEAERDALKETLHDELAENLALREFGGAGPDEGMTQFLRRVIVERDRLLADMRLIAGTEPVDATLDPDRAVRIAKAAIAAIETKEMP